MGTTQILDVGNPQALETAVQALKQGRLVALPTETVYGLAGWIRSPRAIEGIFRMKGRPARDPLIVHIFDESWISRFADLTSDQELVVRKLSQRFWPGPLTFVLPSRAEVAPEVRAGGPTVALRSPSGAFFREVLTKLDDGIAAPSANQFGHISPTCAADVVQEMKGQDLLVIDGGACQVGIESTILEVDASGALRILRPGVVIQQQIDETLSQEGLTKTWIDHAQKAPVVPGADMRHYAPHKECFQLRLDEGRAFSASGVVGPLLRDCVLLDYASSIEERIKGAKSLFRAYLNPSPDDDLEAFTKCLFQTLRMAEQVEGAHAILIHFPQKKQDSWSDAIRNRISRASSGCIVKWDGQSDTVFK